MDKRALPYGHGDGESPVDLLGALTDAIHRDEGDGRGVHTVRSKEAQREDYEERAAIFEYDAGNSRTVSEAKARAIVRWEPCG